MTALGGVPCPTSATGEGAGTAPTAPARSRSSWRSPTSLRPVFAETAGLEEIELRRMAQQGEDSPWFGEDFLWTALFRRG
ncbi:hypothetical protein GCM10009535_50270 [Streptomyces thermocarboxydovorans]|uniref:Methyltransferase n=1 Tax=Streptomyces thermocarboxydovorans TaxID=59298 RepID=A0ABN1HS20_9ACTN